MNDGKAYIGSSKNIEKRWKQHLKSLRMQSHHNIFLQRSWNKYDEQTFELVVLEVTDKLFEREQFWIDELKPEYNLGSVGGGDNITNHPNLELIKTKHSQNAINRWKSLSSEEKEKMSLRYRREKNPNWKNGKTFCFCGNRIDGASKSCACCRDRSAEKILFSVKPTRLKPNKKFQITTKANYLLIQNKLR